jgi:ribosomal protein S18 acetylase RimI-like enzyme
MTTASAPGGNIKVDYRAALAADSRDIARFICIAGDGLHEFLFDDLVPLMSAVDFLTIGVWSEDYPISHRNCFVAVDSATGEVLGAANAFPADDLKEQEYALVPAQRQDHIRALLQLQDWGSMFLNALAVSETCRGLGVGTRLLDWAQERAEAGGFDRLSLHVWQDNMTAVNFYQARGFVETGIAPVANHPRLRHAASILMRRMSALGASPRPAVEGGRSH